MESTEPRGLVADILVGRYHAANGGISERVHRVTILDPSLTNTTDARFLSALRPATVDAPAVVLGETTPGYLVARPCGDQPEDSVGWMASGAWIVSDDYRFAELTGSTRPIPLHDRTETAAQYAALSGD
jgi:hypothetical protein